jgi:hypothetical protein
VTRTATTDPEGRFRLSLLPPGRYSVEAAATGYSSVTLVGVVVVPGEERRVRLEVTRTDEEELVTETINAELQAQGIDGGWVVPTLEAETLPLVRGTLDEVAGLFPVAVRESATRGFGDAVPLEAAGHASAASAVARVPIGWANASRPLVVPRWGSERLQAGVRLVRGERMSNKGNDGVSGARSWDQWTRGALTLGGKAEDGALSGFLSIDHDDRGGGIGSDRRTAITATAALATSERHSTFFIVQGATTDGSADLPYDGETARTRWSIRAKHAWQVSARTANTLDLSVEDRDDDVAASFRLRERSLRLVERVAWLPGSHLRHEVSAGASVRIGLDDRVTIDAPLSGEQTLRGDRDEAAIWVEDELMLGQVALRGGIRVDGWEAAGDSSTEVAPRVAAAWQTRGEEPFVLRGRWGRFNELPGTIDPFQGVEPVSVPGGVDHALLRPVKTDRAVVGVSRDLSGLAAWSIDVVSSRMDDRPYVQNGSLLLHDVERLEVTVGGRLDVFGMADAVLAWTWMDSDGYLPGEELPEHRGSLAIRTALPADWAAAGIVRHESSSRDFGVESPRSSTSLDLSLAKSFAPGDGTARLAIEAFNVTGEESSIRSDRPARSVALNVSYRFGY